MIGGVDTCRRGHPFDETNTYWYLGKRRVCRACNALASMRHRHPHKKTVLMRRMDGRWSKVEAAAFVANLRSQTFCAHCGAQPIDWHNPEHVELNRQHYRITAMAHDRRLQWEIEAEIARCTPLCRRCHMTEDGRLKALIAMATAPRERRPPRPCTECGTMAQKVTRGHCPRCYQRYLARYRTPEQRNADRIRRVSRYYQKTATGENSGAQKAREYRRRLASA